MYTLETLNQYVKACRKCDLHGTRTNTVFGQGSSTADILFIGEGPGHQEDMRGEAFVGPAGQLLTKAIEGIGMTRNDVYIANIIKCRPPNNRDPLPEEMSQCIEYLRWQVKLIRPKIIVCLGRISAMNIIDPEIRITRARGHWINRNGIWIMPTFHPSAVLRDESKKKPFWQDIKAVKDKLVSMET